MQSYSHERRGPHVYELTPSPDDGIEQSGAVIEYDPEYVRQRGKHRSARRVAPLLSMLNSCASGVVVVNIDNGFGAGYNASVINHLVAESRD